MGASHRQFGIASSRVEPKENIRQARHSPQHSDQVRVTQGHPPRYNKVKRKESILTPYLQLIERAQKCADEHGKTVTGVVIEALDALLGGRTTR